MAHNHLAIDINTSAVRFVKLKGDFVLDEKSFDFTDKQDYRYQSQLEDFWNQTTWKELDFEKVSLSWSEKQTTIVPANVFNESDKNALFSLTFGTKTPINEIDYNRLPIQGVVNVYALPSWVKSFFVLRFPRIVMQHEGTHLIRGVFEGQTFKLKTKLILHKEHFLLLVVKENNLKFYSAFDWTTLEDIVYYFSYTNQQLGYDQQLNELEVALGVGVTEDLEKLKTLIESIQNKNIDFKISNLLVEKHQLSCV